MYKLGDGTRGRTGKVCVSVKDTAREDFTGGGTVQPSPGRSIEYLVCSEEEQL